MAANILNKAVAKVIVDLVIWLTGISISIKYFVEYAREHWDEEDFWKKALVRFGVALLFILVPILVINGMLDAVKI